MGKLRVHIVNGPNLNVLGRRDPDVYGDLTYDEIVRRIKEIFSEIDIEFFQSNHEGEIVDYIQNVPDSDAVVINPGAFSHYSYAIRDALEIVMGPKVEVHLSNIFKREDFRTKSVISPVCDGMVSGFGWYGYILAVEYVTRKKR